MSNLTDALIAAKLIGAQGGGSGGGGVLYFKSIYDEATDSSFLSDANGNPVSYEIVKAAIDAGRNCILKMSFEYPEASLVGESLCPCVGRSESQDSYTVYFDDTWESSDLEFEATTKTGLLLKR